MATSRRAEAPLSSIDQADADNAMINDAGDRFFPDSPEAAEFFRTGHGARPEHPERWPFAEGGEGLPEGRCDNPEQHERHDILWGEGGSTDYRTCEGAAIEREPFDPLHCPTPELCFPYGLGPDTSHAACIHGETRA